MNQEKKKKIVVAIIMNIILLFVGICFLQGETQQITIAGNQLTNFAGYMKEADSSLYIDDTIDYEGESFILEDLALKNGIYRISVTYTTDDKNNYISASSIEAGYNGLYADSLYLTPYDHVASAKIWINRDLNDIRISCNYGGTGYFEVNQIMVTPLMNTAGMLYLLVIMAFANIVLFIYWKHKEHTLKQNTIMTGVVVGISVLLASLPLTETYLLEGHDLMYHLMRIEGIREGILAGQFPVIIQPNWLHGYGYDVSVFYSDFFLYFPALLSMLRIPIQDCYKIYIITLNVLTAVISYFSFKKIANNNRYAGYLGCVLYTLSIYRILCIYKRAAVGEYTAMTVLPLLIYAFWYIYTKETTEKRYRFGWMIPVISFTVLIQSHLLTCEMAGIFTAIFCLANWKKTFRKDTFIVLVKIVIGTILLNIGYFIPFMTFSKLGLCVLYDWGGVYSIQEGGTRLASLLSMFLGTGGAYGPGIALLLGVFLFVILAIRQYGKMSIVNDENGLWKLGGIFTILGLLALWMCTNFFPYDLFMNWGAIYNLLAKIQFPFRFLTIAVPFLVAASCVTLVIVQKKYGKSVTVGMIILLLSCVMITDTNYYMDKMNNDPSQVIVYDEAGLDTEYIEGHEYMYASVDMANFEAGTVIPDEGVQLLAYQKVYSDVSLSCSNQNQQEAYVTLPMFIWPGFEAVNTDTGEQMKLEASEGMLIKVALPAGFQGNISVGFKMPVAFRVGQIISLITALFMAGCVGVLLRKIKVS